MKKLLLIFIGILIFLTSCTTVPSSDDIDDDISSLNIEIEQTQKLKKNYSGGLLSVLIEVRLETLKSTKTMLEQKNKGINRFIPISYTVDGKEYSSPANKSELLLSLGAGLNDLSSDLIEAKNESSRYQGGLLQVLALSRVATIESSIATLKQKQLLLKHDIPLYAILPNKKENNGSTFKPTSGKDIDKF